MITEIQKEEIKRQLISFAVTFVSVFLITFGTNLNQIDSFEISTAISILLALSRTAVKVAFEQAVKPLFNYLILVIKDKYENRSNN